jgi:iron complex outermembrane receptor protein
MTSRNALLLSCAIGACLMAAGHASAQSTGQNQTTPSAQPAGPDTAETSDQIKRANETSQKTEASSATTVGAVVVTAAGHSASLQHLPIAVSAYTDERRNLVGIETESDIVNFTPSMSLNGQFLSLRGVGRYTDELGTDPGVAIFVDGVYTSSPDYLNQPDFFTDRIEVLRGPQTISGRNAIGGAVNIVEKRPTSTMHEEARVGFGNFGNGYVDLSVSGPITDNLSFRLADAYADQPSNKGYITNLDSTIHPGSGWSNLFEGQLEWKPTDSFDIWFKLQNFNSDNAASYGVNPTQYASSTVSYCPNGACLGPNGSSLFQTETPPVSNPETANRNVVDVNVPGYVKEKNDWTYTAQATWSLPGATLQYIGGYSQYDYDYLSDLDGTPSNADAFTLISAINTGQQAEKWYQNEVTLKSDNSSKLKWLVGGFQYWDHYSAPYYDEEPNNAALADPQYPGVGGCTFGACPLAPANPTRSTYSQLAHLTSEAQALFGQVDYSITDNLRITGALRYNWDQKQGDVTYREIYDTAGVYFDPGLTALDVTPGEGANGGTPGQNIESAKIHSSDWTGKIGAEWQPDSTTLAYASFTKGYKSSGMALLDISPIPVVAPETLYDYEAGIKKTFDKTLLVDADVYYYDYHNLQQFLTVEGTNNVFSSELISAQRARTYGFELESVWSPTANFQLTFNYSYLNARFTEFTRPGGFPDYSTQVGTDHANLNGNIIPQSPANKVTINPVYTVNAPIGKLTFSATYAFIDKQYYSVFNNPGFLAPSYNNVDLRLLYQPPQGHYTLILYARNVTNQTQIVNYSTGPYVSGPANLIPAGSPAGTFPTSGEVTYYTNPPRAYGIELQMRF